MTAKSSLVNTLRFVVRLMVMLPSRSFETLTPVMSVAPPVASPAGSVNVAAAPAPEAPTRSEAKIAAKRMMRLLKRTSPSLT